MEALNGTAGGGDILLTPNVVAVEHRARPMAGEPVRNREGETRRAVGRITPFLEEIVRDHSLAAD